MSIFDYGSLFALGLLGSTHCLAMCSAFVLCVGARRPLAGLLYQAGRVASYMLAGAVLGSVGLGVRNAWDQAAGRPMLIVAGILMIVLGLAQGGIITFPARGAGWVRRALSGMLKRAGLSGAAGLGILTGLLPCPLLYAALLRSTVTASPIEGALGMGAFFLGTLPAMLSVSLLSPWLARHGRLWWPRLALLVMLAVGGMTLYHGLASTPDGAPVACPNCSM